MPFSLTIGTVVRSVIAVIAVCKCELYALLCEITSLVCVTDLLGSVFLTSLCKCVKWGFRDKVGAFVYQSGKSQGIVR